MTTTQEFKNASLTAQMERLPNCTVRFVVQVTPEKVQDLKGKAIKAINKEVSIPGFRPGKAPEHLVEKQYSKYIDQEFRNKASNEIVKDVIELSKHMPLKRSEGVSLEKFQPNEKGLEIIFNFETFPEMPNVKFDNLKLESPKKEEVKTSDIERTLKELQLYHAKWTEVKDRPVQEGDFVVIDIDVLEEPSYKAYESSRFHVIDKGMPQWARKVVLGLSVGESAEGMSERDEHSGDDFVPRKCRITVHLIQTADLPSLDDELAKKAGVQTVAELRNNVQNQLEREQNNLAQDRLREDVREFLVKEYPFDLPTTDLKNLDADCRKLIERDKDNFKTPNELKEYKERLYLNAQGVVRLAYLIPHIANQLNIPIPSDEECNKRMIETLTHHYLRTQERVPDDQFPYIFNKIQRDLLQERTLDKIIEKNLGNKV